MTTDVTRRASAGSGDSTNDRSHQDTEETRDSKLKAAFDNEISGFEHNTHEKVSVLLLSWDPKIDDLKTAEEVTNLERIFKESFQYTTKRAELTDGSKKPAQIQLNKHLSDFVYDHDAANALLIIYYAGHGCRGQDPGQVHLTPSISLPTGNSAIHEVVWNSAETIIKDTQGDVLVIFDCCYAGELERSVRAPLPRAFEFLAATSAKSTTRKPGPYSFTSALIHSLTKLLDEKGSFSTQDLVSKIRNAPRFPKDQCPRLHERHGSRRKIVMSALTQETIIQARKVNQRNVNDNCIGDSRQDLLVRYIFDKPIDEEMVQEIAKNIQRSINNGDIKAKGASWEGLTVPTNLTYKEAMTIQPFIQALQNAAHAARKRSSSLISPRTPKNPVNGAVQIPSPDPDSDHGGRIDTPKPRLPAQPETCQGLGISEPCESPAILLTIELPRNGESKTPIIAPPKVAHKRGREEDGMNCEQDNLEKRVKFLEEPAALTVCAAAAGS